MKRAAKETAFLRGRMMSLSVEEGSGASSRSKGGRMAQTGSPIGIEALKLFFLDRIEAGTLPGLSVRW